jgi:hypothetical protein
MTTNASTIIVKKDVRIKAIALPIEHGSWGFLLEPLVAGLLIACSPSAPWISLMVIGAFLARRPLKILLSDWQAKRNLPQTDMALKFTALYSVIAVIGLIGSLALAPISSFLPFAIIAPLAAYQIYCDVSRQSRELIAELTGSIAISSSVAVIALAGGWSFPAAAALWGIFIARLIPSILYVRNRLRLEKGKDFSRVLPISAHIGALLCVSALAFYGLSPFLTVAVFAILLGRSIVGLSAYRRKVKAMRIGVWEVAYGALVVLTIVAGYYFQF